MAVIQSIHDKTFKSALADIRVASEFFEQHLPESILALVDLRTLKLSPNSYIDKELKAFSSDILYQIDMKNQNKAYLYLLIEHQSTIDSLMPFRLWNYKTQIWSEYLKQSDEKTLPLIFSLVFYHGHEPYSGNRSLVDLIKAPQDIVKKVLFEPFQVIDTHDISDESLREKRWAGVVQFMFKHVYEREIWPYVQSLVNMLKAIEDEEGANHLVHTLLKYWLLAAETSKEPKAFIDAVQEGISLPNRSEFMTMAEQLIQQGVAQGMQQGMQQGEAHLLIKQLEAKFKILPQTYIEKINRADTDKLNQWGINFINAQSLDEIFE